MGGVPLLLMLASVITYGWQPNKDDSGVEYIIQVSPDQLDQFRNGEISSTIAPEIRGQVSKIIVRVGTDPLPKITPPRVATVGRDSILVSNPDLDPIPVPSIVDQKSVVMKPDPNNAAAGPGFPLPPAGQQPGATAAGRLRGMGANARTGANHMLQNAKSGVAGAAQGAGQAARNLVNNPKRDNHWQTGPGQLKNNQQTTPQLVGPPDLRSQFQANQMATNNSNRNSATGSSNRTRTNQLQVPGQNGNFAKLPNGVQFPNTDPPSTFLASQTKQAANTNSQDLQYQQKLKAYQQEQYQKQLAAQAQQQQLAAQQPQQQMTVQQQMLALQQQQRNGQQVQAPQSSFLQNQQPLGQPNLTNFTSLPTAASLGTPQPNNPMLAQSNMAQGAANARTDVDPRLSKKDADGLPYGAWSYDGWGNPIDRQGRVLDMFGRPVDPHRAHELTVGRSEKEQREQREKTQFAAANHGGRVASNNARYGIDNRMGAPVQGVGSPSDQANGRRFNRDQLGAESGMGPEKETDSHKWSGAIYSWLLFASIVANVYLVLWFWRTQNRYRNLLVSKRTAIAENYA